MEVHEGITYYSPMDIARMIGRSKQTVVLWDKYSDELERLEYERLLRAGVDKESARILSLGKRFIPKPKRFGVKMTRLWSEDQLEEIIKFSKNVTYGLLAQFNKQRNRYLTDMENKK